MLSDEDFSLLFLFATDSDTTQYPSSSFTFNPGHEHDIASNYDLQDFFPSQAPPDTYIAQAPLSDGSALDAEQLQFFNEYDFSQFDFNNRTTASAGEPSSFWDVGVSAPIPSPPRNLPLLPAPPSPSVSPEVSPASRKHPRDDSDESASSMAIESVLDVRRSDRHSTKKVRTSYEDDLLTEEAREDAKKFRRRNVK